jgi:hypothetical protein
MSKVAHRDRKRKLSTEFYHHGIAAPRFISAKMLKTLHPSPSLSHADERAASFDTLPQELFCSIVAYLGPTSTTLVSLAQVTRGHRNMMKTIGDVMLPLAKTRFRIPLPMKSEFESSISLFVRHARIAKDVSDHLLVLEETLKKDFPTLETIKDTSGAGNTVTSFEVDHALDVALCLLGAGQQCDFLSHSDLEARIANCAATTALEWRVSKLCAALGAKAYKYAKVIMCDPSQEQLNSAYLQVTDEYNEEEDDFSVESNHSEDEDVNRLDKACMVMQLTVAKDLDTARQIRNTSNSK